MRESWWNIEDIAGLHLFINDRLERLHLQQIWVRAVLLKRGFLAHAPATTASTLNDKDIILIDMRANAAARHREGDHQIVNAPVGEGAERAHQRAGGFVPVVNGLNQQRPVAFTEVIVAFERTVADLPVTIKVAHQSAIDFIFHRQTSQFIR